MLSFPYFLIFVDVHAMKECDAINNRKNGMSQKCINTKMVDIFLKTKQMCFKHPVYETTCFNFSQIFA